jgi:23S rRNA pseudouridine1911/1915/1917 synthase
MSTSPGKRLSAVVPESETGKRLDQVLPLLFSDYSRSRLQQWNREGKVQVDGRRLKGKEKLFGGETITVEAVAEVKDRWQPQDIPLNIVYEDDSILIIDKPAGLVVHPATGNPDGTLLNALLHHAPELAAVPRAGIVHRLDKDTSGLLVVARTIESQTSLVEQLQQRTVSREYQAVVVGVLTGGGTIDQPIGRHPVDRKRMAVTPGGKPSVTHYRVMERFRAHTHIRVMLETGRTHQIRVHMAHIRYPLVGDPVYGGRLRLPSGCHPELAEALRSFRRQALHAARLGLRHPQTGEWMEWSSPLSDDMQQLLALLKQDVELMKLTD